MLETIFLIIRILILNISLPLVDITSDIYNSYAYYIKGDVWWGSFTLVFVFVPGILETIYWLVSLCCYYKDDETRKNCIWYTVFFGPITFPISTFIWNLQAVFRGKEYFKKNYTKGLVFRSLEAFGEAAPQLLLQVTILIITWKSLSNHWPQIISVLTSVLFLSKTTAEHHFNELAAKEKIVKFRSLLPVLPFFTLNVLLRTFILSVLIAYFKWWIVILFVEIVCANFILSRYSFRQVDWAKDIWTAVCSVASITCFVGKDDVTHYSNTFRNPSVKFRNYYVVNTVWTCVLSAATMIALGVMLNDGTYGADFKCEESPIFSCVPDALPQDNCRRCEEGESRHDVFIFYVIPIWAAATILHLISVTTLSCLCRCLMRKSPVQRPV